MNLHFLASHWIKEGKKMATLKFLVKIGEGGRIEVPELEKLKGTRAEVTVRPLDEENEIDDLLAASESSLDFWDNPVDDEAWNEA
jgi:hypothetical protein